MTLKDIRVFVIMELNSYIAILTPPKHKNQSFSSGVKGIFFYLHCYSAQLSMAVHVAESFFFFFFLNSPTRIKIIYDCLFFLYSFVLIVPLSQCHSLKLSSLKTLLSSLSQTLTSLFHRR